MSLSGNVRRPPGVTTYTMRKLCLLALASLPLSALLAQPPDPPPPRKMMDENAKPAFEVATIKPSLPGVGFALRVNDGGMLTTTGTSLFDLIKFAWDLHPKQIVDAPSWLASERFDVTAKPDTPGMPRANQLKAMIRQLLIDRFALKFHNDKKELSVYAITIAKGGIKITEDTAHPDALPVFAVRPGGFNVRDSTIAEFAAILQSTSLDQPVVDQTGLGARRWNFELRFTPDPSMVPPRAAPTPDADAPPDIFTAFEQQLGLRLHSEKAPASVFVIDHVEQPSAN